MAFKPRNALVWGEIPVTDMARAMAFYSAVFDYDLRLDESGPNPMAILPSDPSAGGTAGHLYPGTPSSQGGGPTLHLAVPGRVEEAIARVRANGGQAQDMVIEIPPGRFAYATDPDGNSLGLFEAKG